MLKGNNIRKVETYNKDTAKELQTLYDYAYIHGGKFLRVCSDRDKLEGKEKFIFPCISITWGNGI